MVLEPSGSLGYTPARRRPSCGHTATAISSEVSQSSSGSGSTPSHKPMCDSLKQWGLEAGGALRGRLALGTLCGEDSTPEERQGL